jgi:pyrroloquinoline quinone biosynthesis protein B
VRLRVLGSAAGGGFPQWNCGCPGCRGVRADTLTARSRTQISCAVSADGDRWILLGASPDVRVQIEAFPPLWPRAPRDTPIAGIVLPNGDLDACLGLLQLRESQPLTIWATAAVRDGFVEGNTLARTLDRAPGQSTWRTLEPGRAVLLDEREALEMIPIAVPGKLPPHLFDRHPSPGDNVGLLLRHRGKTAAWFPSVAGPSRELERALAEADVVFFDGTFHRDDELDGMAGRTARDMAHWPLSGDGGSLRFLSDLPGRTILVHLNNTNPLLDQGSAARADVERAGLEVAFDGLEVTL